MWATNRNQNYPSLIFVHILYIRVLYNIYLYMRGVDSSRYELRVWPNAHISSTVLPFEEFVIRISVKNFRPWLSVKDLVCVLNIFLFEVYFEPKSHRPQTHRPQTSRDWVYRLEWFGERTESGNQLIVSNKISINKETLKWHFMFCIVHKELVSESKRFSIS